MVVDEILTKNEEDEEGIITIPILNKSNCKSLKTENHIRRNSKKGGYRAIDVSDESLKNSASFATAAISKALNFVQPLTTLRIISAEKQVVNGFNYKMQLELEEDDDLTYSIKCDVVVYNKRDQRTLTQCSCCGVSWKPAVPTLTLAEKPVAVTPRAYSIANVAKDKTREKIAYSFIPTTLSTLPTTSIVGGYNQVDVNDKSVKEMASFATTTVSKAVNSAKPFSVVRILSAKKQVVAGMNYDLQIELNDSKSNLIKCHVVVYDQSWTNTRRVTQCSCCGSSWSAASDQKTTLQHSTVKTLTSKQSHIDVTSVSKSGEYSTANVNDKQSKKTTNSFVTTTVIKPLPTTAKPSINGGYTDVDVTDKSVKEMASFATTTVSKALNSVKPLSVVRILSAKTQVVAGMNYDLQIELKDGKSNLIKCHVIVYDQSWTNTRRVTQCSCCGDSSTVANYLIKSTAQPATGRKKTKHVQIAYTTESYALPIIQQKERLEN